MVQRSIGCQTHKYDVTIETLTATLTFFSRRGILCLAMFRIYAMYKRTMYIIRTKPGHTETRTMWIQHTLFHSLTYNPSNFVMGRGGGMYKKAALSETQESMKRSLLTHCAGHWRSVNSDSPLPVVHTYVRWHHRLCLLQHFASSWRYQMTQWHTHAHARNSTCKFWKSAEKSNLQDRIISSQYPMRLERLRWLQTD